MRKVVKNIDANLVVSEKTDPMKIYAFKYKANNSLDILSQLPNKKYVWIPLEYTGSIRSFEEHDMLQDAIENELDDGNTIYEFDTYEEFIKWIKEEN